MTQPGQSTASRPMPRPDDPSTWSDETRRDRGLPPLRLEQEHALVATVPGDTSHLGEVTVATLEFRAPIPDPIPGAMGAADTFVVARMTRGQVPAPGDAGQRGGYVDSWRLQMLPDAQHRPDVMFQTDGSYRTSASTQAEAQAVMVAAAQAMLTWMAENDRLKTALVEGITAATHLHGETL